MDGASDVVGAIVGDKEAVDGLGVGDEVTLEATG